VSACFGAGLLDFVPLEYIADDVTSAEAQQVLRDFAALGLSSRFFEVIEGSVVEVTVNGGEVAVRPLGEAEAAPYVAAMKETGGSAPSSIFPSCVESDVYLPNYLLDEDEEMLRLADSPFDGLTVSALESTIVRLQEWVAYIEAGELDDDLEFTLDLIEQMRVCQKHNLIFSIGF